MLFKKKIKRIKFFFAGILGSLIIRLLIGTMRIIERPDNYPERIIRQGENVIFALGNIENNYLSNDLSSHYLINFEN